MGRRRRLLVFWVSRRTIWAGLALLGLLSFVWYITAPPPFPALAPLTESVSGKRIVVDAGHGGIDAGAKSKEGLAEKEITLDIAKHLKRMFSRVGAYVVMTREDDNDLVPDGFDGKFFKRKRFDLLQRVLLANESKADLYLSVHANSFPESVWSGAQTFFKSDDLAGRELARCIQTELVEKLGPNHRKAKSASYRVLNDTRMPAALVEVGFLSNPRESHLLAEAEYREKLAQCIYEGTVKFLVKLYQSHGEIPPPAGGEARPSGAPIASEPGRTHLQADEAVLYFASAGNEDCLMPEVRVVSGLSVADSIPAKARLLIHELIRGPGEESVLSATLPRETRLLGVAFSDGRLYVNFGEELCGAFWGGGRPEELAIYSLVDTLTSLDGVRSVQFTIDGHSDATIAGHIPLDFPFERSEEIIGHWKE